MGRRRGRWVIPDLALIPTSYGEPQFWISDASGPANSASVELRPQASALFAISRLQRSAAASSDEPTLALRRQRSQVRILSGAPDFNDLGNGTRNGRSRGSTTEARDGAKLDGLSHQWRHQLESATKRASGAWADAIVRRLAHSRIVVKNQWGALRATVRHGDVLRAGALRPTAGSNQGLATPFTEHEQNGSDPDKARKDGDIAFPRNHSALAAGVPPPGNIAANWRCSPVTRLTGLSVGSKSYLLQALSAVRR